MPIVRGETCRVCGRPIRVKRGALLPRKHLCYTCTHWEPRFAIARSAVIYDDFIRDLISRFKYEGQVTLGQALGRVLAQEVKGCSALNSYREIIPIPLHPETADKRSFNQALILAEEVADKTHRRVISDALVRLPGSALQHTLSGWKRKQGLAGQFHVTRPELVRGKKILLIDDILTTGSTLNEAAAALIKAGARRVAAATLAIGISEKDGF